jgi:hypothetical protein
MPSVTIDLTAGPSAAPAVTQALEQRLGASGQLEQIARKLGRLSPYSWAEV